MLVRNGVYREKLYVNAGHLSLVGEDRERTRIEFAELRRNWRKDHPDDWGAAVLNIGPEVTDLVLANLTVRNDYGSRNGGEDDHQFAIRSGGNATTHRDPGRGRARGRRRHAEPLERHERPLLPRGTARSRATWTTCARAGGLYITNSRFYGRNLTASIWHDFGSKDRDQKLVIRRSRFDGVPGFPLGRNHRDGQFYLLEATCSRRTWPTAPSTRRRRTIHYLWGPRYYYWGCRREGGDFAWFADNLAQAPGAPDEADITPAWTFAGRWDPEATLPAVLPFAAVPRPENGARGRARASRCAGSPAATRAASASISARRRRLRSARSSEDSSFETGPLAAGRTYYWRVDTVTPAGVIHGHDWSFVAARKESR